MAFGVGDKTGVEIFEIVCCCVDDTVDVVNVGAVATATVAEVLAIAATAGAAAVVVIAVVMLFAVTVGIDDVEGIDTIC